MRRVVIIEDEESIVDLMEEALASAGVSVSWHIARDGTEGMRWAETVGVDRPVPDLAIVDLNLPSFSGLEILARLRSRALPDFPIVVMSGSLRPSDREAAVAGGATLFLPKPDDIEASLAHGRLLKSLMDGARAEAAD